MQGQVDQWPEEIGVERHVLSGDVKLLDMWHGGETSRSERIEISGERLVDGLDLNGLTIPPPYPPWKWDVHSGQVPSLWPHVKGLFGGLDPRQQGVRNGKNEPPSWLEDLANAFQNARHGR